MTLTRHCWYGYWGRRGEIRRLWEDNSSVSSCSYSLCISTLLCWLESNIDVSSMLRCLSVNNPLSLFAKPCKRIPLSWMCFLSSQEKKMVTRYWCFIISFQHCSKSVKPHGKAIAYVHLQSSFWKSWVFLISLLP